MDSSPSKLTIDEIRWLDAEARTSPSPIPMSLATISSRKAILPITSTSGSPHARDTSQRHTHQYLNTASDTSAIAPHSPNEIVVDNVKAPIHLRYILTAPTSISAPLPEPPKSRHQRGPWKPYSDTSSSYTPLQPVPPPTPSSHPSPEWIYRRPKSPRSHSSSRSRPSISASSSLSQNRFRPKPGYSHPYPHHTRLSSQSHVQPHRFHHHSHHRYRNHQQNAFWSAVLRPPSSSEKAIPISKADPSAPLPGVMHIRTASVTSTISSSSTSSSRPQTPTSTMTMKHKPHHRSYEYTSPSKSILARAASISTKNSTSTTATGNKSVKFVDMPTIHYASAGYWDTDSVHMDDMNSRPKRVDMDTEADVDVNTGEVLCSTPVPEKEKAKGLKRLISLTRKPSRAEAPSSQPTISGPFALGTVSIPPPTLASIPSLPALSDSSPYFKSTSKPKSATISGPFPLRSTSSMESFRSTKSSGGRSVKSLGSIKSNKSTGIFRAWLGRMGVGGALS